MRNKMKMCCSMRLLIRYCPTPMFLILSVSGYCVYEPVYCVVSGSYKLSPESTTSANEPIEEPIEEPIISSSSENTNGDMNGQVNGPVGIPDNAPAGAPPSEPQSASPSASPTGPQSEPQSASPSEPQSASPTGTQNRQTSSSQNNNSSDNFTNSKKRTIEKNENVTNNATSALFNVDTILQIILFCFVIYLIYSIIRNSGNNTSDNIFVSGVRGPDNTIGGLNVQGRSMACSF